MSKGGPAVLGRIDQPRVKDALGSADRPVFYVDLAGVTDVLRDVNMTSPSQSLDQGLMVLGKFRDVILLADVGEQSSTSEIQRPAEVTPKNAPARARPGEHS